MHDRRRRAPTKKVLIPALAALAAAGLACASTPATIPPPPQVSIFDRGRTALGFFPSPPQATFESILTHFADLGEHADVVLVQPNIPWSDFLDGPDADSQAVTDILNQLALSRQNGLEVILVVDPLNGLNRREFFGLPPDLTGADFGTPEVRRAYRDFTLRVLRDVRPRYLGLASEINTYADAHPEDFSNFLSLYRETYAAVKAEAPETRVFVTFQWEDMNNLIPGADEGRRPYAIDWNQVEAFEPELDVWAISSYPFVVFPAASDIPPDYYSPLLARTEKPLAVAEGGFTSRPVGPFSGNPEDQVDYLKAIHDQIGGRLAFWIYLLLNDFDPESYHQAMRSAGRSRSDIETLGMFEAVGLRDADGAAKPALALWDGYREP